jgi:hypothetical protein
VVDHVHNNGLRSFQPEWRRISKIHAQNLVTFGLHHFCRVLDRPPKVVADILQAAGTLHGTHEAYLNPACVFGRQRRASPPLRPCGVRASAQSQEWPKPCSLSPLTYGGGGLPLKYVSKDLLNIGALWGTAPQIFPVARTPKP